jgi:TPR repeat protein
MTYYKKALSIQKKKLGKNHPYTIKTYRNIGLLYNMTGDYRRSYYWLEKAAVLGDDVAQSNIGKMYYSGKGVKQDYSLSFDWCLKAAVQGNNTAQLDVGYMYENGEGTDIDYGKAYE